MQVDARRLVPMLTQDVLVHTWDLARAVGADDSLDPEMCRMFWERLPPSADAQVASGMFAPPVEIADSAAAPARLLARLGRDPDWQ